jgi:hypothetical protein
MTYVPQNRANLVAAAAAAAAAEKAQRRRRRWWHRLTGRTLALVVAGTLVPAGGAVYAIVRQAVPPNHVERPIGTGAARPPVARASSDLIAGYARLGDPPTAAEGRNAGVRRAATYNRPFGLEPSAARILARIDGKRLWLVPGNGYACLGLEEPDGSVTLSCATEAVALRDGITANDKDAVYGVLPDGVDQIEVTDDRDGYRHIEPVVDNAYVLKNVSATIRYPVGAKSQATFRVIGPG